MIEQIQTTLSKRGFTSYWIPDITKGVPYAAVNVNASGDYWLTLYGVLCFENHAHSKIISIVNPTGKNITMDIYYYGVTNEAR